MLAGYGPQSGIDYGQFAFLLEHPGADQVGAPDEVRNITVISIEIDFLGRTAFNDAPRLHYRYGVRQGHSLEPVMGNVDRRDAQCSHTGSEFLADRKSKRLNSNHHSAHSIPSSS